MEFFTIDSFETQTINPRGIEITKMGTAFQVLERQSELKTLDQIMNKPFVFVGQGFSINPEHTVFSHKNKNLTFAVVEVNQIFEVTDKEKQVHYCSVHESVLKHNTDKKALEVEISKQSISSDDPIVAKALHWLDNGRVGLSSATMCATLFPQLTKHHKFNNKIDDYGNVEINWPHDNSDFERCVKFLEAVPEARNRLNELKSVSKEWSNLVEKWDNIEKMINDKNLSESYELIKECLGRTKKILPK